MEQYRAEINAPAVESDSEGEGPESPRPMSRASSDEASLASSAVSRVGSGSVRSRRSISVHSSTSTSMDGLSSFAQDSIHSLTASSAADSSIVTDVSSHRDLSHLKDVELRMLYSTALRMYRGIEIKDRKWGMRRWKSCFVGSEAVTYLLDTVRCA